MAEKAICELCGKEAKTAHGLKVHMARKHGAPKAEAPSLRRRAAVPDARATLITPDSLASALGSALDEAIKNLLGLVDFYEAALAEVGERVKALRMAYIDKSVRLRRLEEALAVPEADKEPVA